LRGIAHIQWVVASEVKENKNKGIERGKIKEMANGKYIAKKKK
jgi:hypothetical protein